MTHEGTLAYIEDIARHDSQRVIIRGWLHARRSSGKIHFLTVRDGSGFIQGVMSKAAVDDETFRLADHLTQETSVIVSGTVRADTRAPGGFELDLTTLEVDDGPAARDRRVLHAVGGAPAPSVAHRARTRRRRLRGTRVRP